MKKVYWLILLSMIVNVMFSVTLWYANTHNTKESKVVDISRLYSDFIMTQELNKDYNASVGERNKQIDSLNTKIVSLESELNTAITPEIKSQKLMKLNMANSNYRDLVQVNQQVKFEFEQQIWNQLNAYMLAFAENEKYPLILGTKNEGNVLYMNDKNDITSELLDFVNDKYLGRL